MAQRTEYDEWSYLAVGMTAPRIRHRNRIMHRLALALIYGWPKRRRWE